MGDIIMEANKSSGIKYKKKKRNKIRQYQYNGYKPFTFIYKNSEIKLCVGDIITMYPNKLTSKLKKMLTEVEE